MCSPFFTLAHSLITLTHQFPNYINILVEIICIGFFLFSTAKTIIEAISCLVRECVIVKSKSICRLKYVEKMQMLTNSMAIYIDDWSISCRQPITLNCMTACLISLNLYYLLFKNIYYR